MQWTEQERKMIAFLRHERRIWPVTRIVMFIVLLVLFVGAVIAWQQGATWYVLVPWVGFIGYLLAFLVETWHGRAEVVLLLRLLDQARSGPTSSTSQDGAA